MPHFGGGPARELSPDERPWPLKLLVILAGYSTIAAPVALFIYVYRMRERGRSPGYVPRTSFGRFIKCFAVGDSRNRGYDAVEPPLPLNKKANSAPEGGNRFMHDFSTLAFYFAGIQSTLVLMGFLQERIITQGYSRLDKPEAMEKFGDAQFLVFCNRIVALCLCSFVLFSKWSRQPPHIPPLYVHSYTSFSNTISSWCQYEALKYVSFPTQTICKASKVVATMLMGRVVRGQRYTWPEYGCGTCIALGASLFLLSSRGSMEGGTATSFSGMILMAGYLIFDAFTLNWQKSLFDIKPKVSKYQMMMGVNAFSAVLCIVSLLEQGTLSASINFALEHEKFAWDTFFLSLSGATGQLFIYSTIDKFGPIVFAVIMTIRQMLSILLSAFYYGHPMSLWAILGFAIVFLSMFLDIYRRYFEKKTTRPTNSKP